MNKERDITRLMRDIQRAIDDVEDVVVATCDGLPVASTTSDSRAESVSAMAATVHSLSEQVIATTKSAVSDGTDADEGTGRHTIIRGTDGCMIVHGAGDRAVIALHTGAQPNVGLVNVELPKAAAELESVLS